MLGSDCHVQIGSKKLHSGLCRGAGYIDYPIKCSLGVTRHRQCSLGKVFIRRQSPKITIYGSPANAGPQILAFFGLFGAKKIATSPSLVRKVFSSRVAVTRHLNTWLDYCSIRGWWSTRSEREWRRRRGRWSRFIRFPNFWIRTSLLS